MANKHTRPHTRIGVYIEDELYAFFQALSIEPSTGMVKRNFSKVVGHLLRQERQRLIEAAKAATNGGNNGTDEGSLHEARDGGNPADALEAAAAEATGPDR